MAAGRGFLDCLQYAHTVREHDLDETVMLYASRYLDCMEYAHINNCPWDIKVIPYAIKYRAYECVKYAVFNGCPLPASEHPNDLLPLPEWFTSSPLVHGCAPMPPSTTLRCISEDHRSTVHGTHPQFFHMIHSTLLYLGYSAQDALNIRKRLGTGVVGEGVYYYNHIYMPV